MADDSVYADLLDALSPLTKAGIDPDEARMDRAGTMAKLMGTDSSSPAPWYQQPEDDEPQQQGGPQRSQNGNVLPPGLQSRAAQPAPQQAPQAPSAPAASVPASVTPDGDPATVSSAPTLANQNAGVIGQMGKDYMKASSDVDAEAAQPDLATQTRVLEQQRVNAQRRQMELQSPNDPQTGKMLPEYKPSFAQRIMRGVNGVAKGGILGAIDPTVRGGTAYGAPNKDFAIDQSRAAGAVAGTDQQLVNAAANYKATSERLKQVAADRRALATSGKDATGASVDQQKVPIEQEQADTARTLAEGKGTAAPPKNYEEAVIAANMETDPAKKAALTAAAHQMATTEQRRFNAQAQRPSAELQQYSDWKSAFTRDNKRPPTADEIATQMKRSGKVDANAPDEVSAAVAESIGKKQEWADTVKRRPDGNYKDANGKTLSAEEFEDKVDQYRKDLNVKIAPKGYVMDEHGQVVKKGAKPASFSAAPARVAPPRPQGAPSSYVPFTDSTGQDHWIDPAKLAAAKQRDPGLRTY